MSSGNSLLSTEERMVSEDGAKSLLLKLSEDYITNVQQLLKNDHGLHISPLGVAKCSALCSTTTTNKSPPSPQRVFDQAINISLKHCGQPFMEENEWHRGTKLHNGLFMVQIVSLRNLSAPTISQESQAYPRMIGMSISDGFTKIQAIEYEHVGSLKLSLPPGTKIVLRDVVTDNGIAILRPLNVVAICGNVHRLTEAWRIKQERTFAKSLAPDEDPPPKLVPFSNVRRSTKQPPVTTNPRPQQQQQQKQQQAQSSTSHHQSHDTRGERHNSKRGGGRGARGGGRGGRGRGGGGRGGGRRGGRGGRHRGGRRGGKRGGKH